jgi:hypothetical protein
MSKIADIKTADNKIDAAQLITLVSQYDTDLANLAALIEIKGKKLEHANRENPAWHLYYDQRRAELNTLQKYMEMEVARVRGRLYKQYVETYNRDLGDRAIEKYIDNEEAYLEKYELYLEIKELHDKFDGAVEAFKSRGYALNNITKIRVAAIEDGLV